MSNFVTQTELDAAKALLELRLFHSGNKMTKSDEPTVEQPPVTRIYGTFISAPIANFSTNTSTPTPKPFLAKWRNSTETEKIEQIPKKHEIDTQTQSIPDLLKKTDDILKEVTEENLALKEQLRALQEERLSTDSLSERSSESSKEDSPESLRRSKRRYRSNNTGATSSALKTRPQGRIRTSTSAENVDRVRASIQHQSSSHTTTISNEKQFKIFQKEATNPKAGNQNLSGGVVPIGNGHALIPARILKHIDWSCHSNATRKLLRAVFPRQVLATHSLTGKRSPAFPNKPPKKKLNVSLVHDIVTTVSERCGVPENIVRTSITTKCADESKMLRTRLNQTQTKPKIKKLKKENVPPSDASEISED